MWRKLGKRVRLVRGYTAMDVTQTRWMGLRGRSAKQVMLTDKADVSSGEAAEDDDFGGALAEQPSHELSMMMRHHRRTVQRLIKRDAPQFQTRGKFNIRKRNEDRQLLLNDFYHVVLSQKTTVIIMLFWMIYILSFCVFAVFWFWYNDACDVGLTSFTSALYFSIETQMSIGYGAKDQYFNDCWEVSWLLAAQGVFGMLLDFVIVAFVFEKTSRTSNRALTVIFSDTAVLKVVGGFAHLEFRIAEMASRKLLQAVIQVYVVQHHEVKRKRKRESEREVEVEVAAVELQEPYRDNQTGVLFFGLPSTVVHRIDRESPLAPPTPDERTPEPQEVLEHLRQRPWLEIVVLVGGIEDSSASSVEARHSYTLDDIFWDRMFTPCVSIDSDGWHSVDFEALHETIPASWGEVDEADVRVRESSSTPPPLRDLFFTCEAVGE